MGRVKIYDRGETVRRSDGSGLVSLSKEAILFSAPWKIMEGV